MKETQMVPLETFVLAVLHICDIYLFLSLTSCEPHEFVNITRFFHSVLSTGQVPMRIRPLSQINGVGANLRRFSD